MNKYITYFTIVLSVLAYSCDKDDDEATDKNYQLVDWTECSFSLGFQVGDGFIINTQDEYQAMIDIIAFTNNCVSYNYPEIDFTEHTLLGLYTEGGGCEASYDREFIRNDETHIYNYNIIVNYTGDCDMLIMHANWILVDKIEDSSAVHFEFTKYSN